jgi:hypothetical protein
LLKARTSLRLGNCELAGSGATNVRIVVELRIAIELLAAIASVIGAVLRVPGHDDHGFRRNVINQSSAS